MLEKYPKLAEIGYRAKNSKIRLILPLLPMNVYLFRRRPKQIKLNSVNVIPGFWWQLLRNPLNKLMQSYALWYLFISAILTDCW